MQVISDLLGDQFRLTDERWQHILKNHPELQQKKNKISQTLMDPDVIVQSRLDPQTRIYQQKYQDKYFFTVVVHLDKKFIITAFITDKIKLGKILWQK